MNLFNWLISPSDGFAASAEIACDIGLFASTLLAIVFVGAEYAVVHFDWSWGANRKRLFALLVMVGFSGELIFEIGSFRYAYALQSSQADIIKGLSHETETAKSKAEAALADSGDAKANAAMANSAASDARGMAEVAASALRELDKKEQALKRAISEDQILLNQINEARLTEFEWSNDRDVTEEQYNRLAENINGRSMKIYLYVACDTEADYFAIELEMSLDHAGYKASRVVPKKSGSRDYNCFSTFPAADRVHPSSLTLFAPRGSGFEKDMASLWSAMERAQIGGQSTLATPTEANIPRYPAIFIGRAPGARQMPRHLLHWTALIKWLHDHPSDDSPK